MVKENTAWPCETTTHSTQLYAYPSIKQICEIENIIIFVIVIHNGHNIGHIIIDDDWYYDKTRPQHSHKYIYCYHKTSKHKERRNANTKISCKPKWITSKTHDSMLPSISFICDRRNGILSELRDEYLFHMILRLYSSNWSQLKSSFWLA